MSQKLKRKTSKEEPSKDSSKKPSVIKLPSISRLFTDFFGNRRKNWSLALWRGAFGLLLLLLLGGIFLTSVALYKNLERKEKADLERQRIVSQIHYWEGIVEKFRGYRDGYFQLAVLEYQLGNNEKAKMYVEQVLLLDPNFEEGRRLEKILEEK